jgi:hypothetical protein
MQHDDGWSVAADSDVNCCTVRLDLLCLEASGKGLNLL